MKTDIALKDDIKLLVDTFYNKVRADDCIGYIFTNIAKVNWEKHLPVMCSFFENMLFYTGTYTGNPMELHNHISRLFPLTKEHFERWESLFNQTIDELFEGEKAATAKQRAKRISAVMQSKIIGINSPADNIF